MNIRKYIRFLRQSKQLNWHIGTGQPLQHHPARHDNEKVVEYKDHWTLPFTRPQIWFGGNSNYTPYNHTRWPR